MCFAPDQTIRTHPVHDAILCGNLHVPHSLIPPCTPLYHPPSCHLPPAGTIMRGKLHLIDLAGSERLSKTGAQVRSVNQEV